MIDCRQQRFEAFAKAVDRTRMALALASDDADLLTRLLEIRRVLGDRLPSRDIRIMYRAWYHEVSAGYMSEANLERAQRFHERLLRSSKGTWESVAEGLICEKEP